MKFIKLPTNEPVVALVRADDDIVGTQLYIFTETEIFRMANVDDEPIRVW